MTKRFIAGASCPACQKMDTIVMYLEQGNKVFECVECGHKELLSDAQNQPSETSKTKTAATKTPDKDTMIQWISIDEQ